MPWTACAPARPAYEYRLAPHIAAAAAGGLPTAVPAAMAAPRTAADRRSTASPFVPRYPQRSPLRRQRPHSVPRLRILLGALSAGIVTTDHVNASFALD